MDLPRNPEDDRRTVPRHLRDAEHDQGPAAPGSGTRAEDALPAWRRAGGWICAGLLAALLAAGAWMGLAAQ